MEEISTLDKHNWIQCKSKSHPNRCYLFNKKTGETKWCSETSSKNPNTTQNSFSAKAIMKTPAQDRLKRLQNNLEKVRSKESSMSKPKDNRKKIELASKIVKDVKNGSFVDSNLSDKPSLPKQLSSKLDVTPDRSKQTSVNETKQTSVNKSKQTSADQTPSAQGDKLDNHKPIPINDNKPAGGVEQTPKFKIPKVPLNATPKSSLKRTQKRKREETVSHYSESKKGCLSIANSLAEMSSLRKECTAVASPKKNNLNTEARPLVRKELFAEAKKCDINDNEQPSKEDPKSGIMSKIKGFCNNLYKMATNTQKEKPPDKFPKQSNLSYNSKPSFKCKKPIRSPAVPENANERLQRLRKSLQAQQTSSTHAQITSPTTSALVLATKSCIPLPKASLPECEPMDWQPISEDPPNKIISSSVVPVVKSENVPTKSEHYDTVNENLLRLASEKKQTMKWRADFFYFVIDTNVFLEYLTFVEDLTTMKLCNTKGTIIYVPYCVLQELDKLKIRSPSESIKTRSTRAIKFLNKFFQEKDSRIQAQSAADENKRIIKVTSPDDSILNCCLQVKQHIDNLLLLTEDINLRNKALCNDILVSTKSDLISKHESLI